MSDTLASMPVTAEIDKAARLVVTTATGRVSKPDFVAHIEGVWRDADVAGFDELIDVTEADVSGLSADDLAALVKVGVSVDLATSSRLALCVSSELGYGLSRMYGSMRETNDENARQINIFYDIDSARAWIAEGRVQSR